MFANESEIDGVSCGDCKLFRTHPSDRDSEVTVKKCVALPSRTTVHTRPESFCVLGIQRGTGDRFDDLISRHEAHKGIQ